MQDKYAIWKWLVLVAAAAFSLVSVLPMDQKVRKGIDLIGGTSITVQLDEAEVRRAKREQKPDATAEAIEAEVANVMRGAQDRALEVIRNRVDWSGGKESVIYPAKGNRIVVQLPGADAKQIAEAEEALSRPAYLQFRVVHKDNARLAREVLDKGLAPEGYRIETLSAGPYFVADGNFKPEQRTPAYRERLGRFQVPDAAHEMLLEPEVVDGRTVYAPCFVNRRAELTGDALENASVDYGQMGEPMVMLRFDSKGAQRFGQITSELAPGGARNPSLQEFRQLAIVLDGTLYSAPRINEAIYGGSAQITGRFSVQDANKLANVLRAGALPAPVTIVEKRTISASLGKDAIESGLRGALYGAVLVVLFMAGYYLLAGLVANVALVLMVVLMPLGMIMAAGFLGIFASEGAGGGPVSLPVLTLPGIAGFALTIGMAVDANVLIFERIREEQAAGKRFWSAVEAGYNRAFTAIMDANLTTLLTGIILFVFGSGPIRGYAVTLSAGVIMSMFTAIVVTKLIFGLMDGKVQSLKMLQLVKLPAIDFLKWGKAAGAVSVLVIAVTWALMFARGNKNPGEVFAVDFTGGAALTYSYQGELSAEDVRAALEGAGVRSPTIQFQQSIDGSGTEHLVVQVSTGNVDGRSYAEIARETLTGTFAASNLVLEQDDEVGSQVGKELTGRAIKAIVLSLLGIIIYLWIRFEIGFAMGAIAALLHDVLVTVGVYVLLGEQLSLPIVAALLTIVGFSVNDTIVIFDRIREDMRLQPNRPIRELCNLGINQCMSRTILTTFTVMITVVMLLIFGGGSMYDFALAMFIGLISGTYSTIYVATPVALLFHRTKKPDFRKK